jgi:RND family efflux transporter MFP subunit
VPLTKKLLVFPPIALGVAVLILAVSCREGGALRPPGEQALKARTIVVKKLTVLPRALAFGSAEPKSVWRGIAQISGQVATVNSSLNPGELLPKGTVLLTIDRTDYELAVVQATASLRQVEAELSKLAVSKRNDAALLEIERRSLKLARAELRRTQGLRREGTATDTDLDERERSVLAQELKVKTISNNLESNTAQEKVLAAQKRLSAAKLASAERDLTRTQIVLPFDCRVAETNVEETQFVAQGQELVVADSIDVTEVAAQIALERINPILRNPGRELPALGKDFWKSTSSEMFAKAFGISAKVRVRAGSLVFEWPARFVRASPQIDSTTRTVGLVVAVDDPYLKARPGVHPPLVKGMYCEVEVSGKPRPGCIVVPREALRGNGDTIYVLDAKKRLEVRRVEIDLVQARFVVLSSGLSEGEHLVVSDLVPAIPGTLLESRPDEELSAWLTREAAGEGSAQ